jgi:tetratricopeptide (TPR) repeat protein
MPEKLTIDACAQPTRPTRRSLTNRQLAVALVLALTFAVYVGTISYQFVFDDVDQIVKNPSVKSWSLAPSYFTEHVWKHKEPGAHGNYYRPVFMVWMLVSYTLFGLNASWWHLTTVLVHVCVTLMVYLLARRLLKDQWTAWMTALIFGLHPVHIEAVAWVSGVTEPLLALLLIPAFLFYLNWREGASATDAAPVSKRNRRAWLAASLAFYAVAMFEKETALVLPMLVFLYEWIYSPRQSRMLRVRDGIKVAAPYLALSVVYLSARAIVLKGIGHEVTPLPLLTIVLTWPSLLWTYIKMLAWPVGLSAFYDTPYVTTPGVANMALPLLAVAAAAGLLWAWSRKTKAVAFASALLVVPLLPLMNLSVFFTGEIAHDRYLYLPSIGFSILVALALKQVGSGPVRLFGQPAFQVMAAIALAVLLGLATMAQNVHWASDLLLFYRGVNAAPNNIMAKNNLATEMVTRKMYDEAITLYQQVLAQSPNYWMANYNLGYVYYKLGRYEEAETYLARSIDLHQVDSDQFARLALVKMKMDRLDEADGLLRRAIEMRPDAAGYHYALGTVLRRMGDTQGAINEFEAELVNNPDQAAAQGQLAELKSKLETKP